VPTRWMDSPIGPLRLSSSAGLLTAIGFDATDVAESSDDALLVEAERQLTAYFRGEITEFDLPVANDGTEFQQKVWRAVRKIGYGHTKSYGQIAEELGYDAGTVSRAVGAANGANPVPIVVPCHRVIAGDGKMTGYAGGIERKQYLLRLEQPGHF
jgi:methylated-DNA-[protein]-cysteine S-methyltransferase